MDCATIWLSFFFSLFTESAPSHHFDQCFPTQAPIRIKMAHHDALLTHRPIHPLLMPSARVEVSQANISPQYCTPMSLSVTISSSFPLLQRQVPKHPGSSWLLLPGWLSDHSMLHSISKRAAGSSLQSRRCRNRSEVGLFHP
ncbi:hypothetical protein QBC35DRAFT_276298 [Podospora australis]|uniref:Secreted protein n=1 Tax=Podospora australis TaxID=1536484 RepID=A0AAN6X455_9PEZI|nr:hypothetical protein QBC35DRAFT_276298 [Podospora australis]